MNLRARALANRDSGGRHSRAGWNPVAQCEFQFRHLYIGSVVGRKGEPFPCEIDHPAEAWAFGPTGQSFL